MSRCVVPLEMEEGRLNFPFLYFFPPNHFVVVSSRFRADFSYSGTLSRTARSLLLGYPRNFAFYGV